MPSRYKPLETTGLYFLVLGFSLFFFVAGVLVGSWLPREEAVPELLAVGIPQEDWDKDLGIYRELVGSDQSGPAEKVDETATRDSSGEPEKQAALPVPDSSSQSQAVPGPITFTVQVGAMENIRLVEQLVLRLGAKGYPSKVIKPGEQGNNAYLIWVDFFDIRAEAQTLEERLKMDGFPTFIKPVDGAVRR